VYSIRFLCCRYAAVPESGCKKYTVMDHGRPVQFQCGPHTLFDYKTCDCNHQRNVNCPVWHVFSDRAGSDIDCQALPNDIFMLSHWYEYYMDKQCSFSKWNNLICFWHHNTSRHRLHSVRYNCIASCRTFISRVTTHASDLQTVQRV